MITAPLTKVQYFKSDILRILRLIHERSDKRLPIDWVNECKPLQSKQHGLLFFRFMLSFGYVKRESISKGEIYIWISKEKPHDIFESVSDMLPEYEDQHGSAKDIFECVGMVRKDERIEKEPQNNLEKIMKFAETKLKGFTLSEAIFELKDIVAEKSVSPILSELAKPGGKLMRFAPGTYIMHKYATSEMVVYTPLTSNKIDKNNKKEYEIEILSALGGYTLSLADIVKKLPDVEYPTLNARLRAMLQRGHLASPRRGYYKAATEKIVVETKLEVKTNNVSEQYTDRSGYQIQLDACEEKLTKLNDRKEQLKKQLEEVDAEIVITEEARVALSGVITNLEKLKTLNISSHN